MNEKQFLFMTRRPLELKTLNGENQLFCILLGLRLGLGLLLGLKVKYTTPPKTSELEKAFQNYASRASTLLLLRISDLDQPWYWVRGWAGFRVKVEIRVRV